MQASRSLPIARSKTPRRRFSPRKTRIRPQVTFRVRRATSKPKDVHELAQILVRLFDQTMRVNFRPDAPKTVTVDDSPVDFFYWIGETAGTKFEACQIHLEGLAPFFAAVNKEIGRTDTSQLFTDGKLSFSQIAEEIFQKL